MFRTKCLKESSWSTLGARKASTPATLTRLMLIDRRATHFCLSLLLCLLAQGTVGAEDKFAPAVPIQAGGKLIDVEGYRSVAPYFGDFDGDGLNDLLVGQREYQSGQEEPGRLRIYRNVGTKNAPRFDGFEWFRVNGEIAELPDGGIFCPQLVDLNGDGKQDLVTPTPAGMVYWYRRTADGGFADAQPLKLANGESLQMGRYAGCHVVDWDGDGDNDLIVAGLAQPKAQWGEVWFVENRGTPAAMLLAPPKPLEVDGDPLKAPKADLFPVVADWNGDGKLDLLLGLRDGSVLLFENKGGRRTPKLANARQLVELPPLVHQRPVAGLLQRGMGGNLCVTDWDQDGTLDILLGDAQEEVLPPAVPGGAAELERIREEAIAVLSDYRQMRSLEKRLVGETQGKQKELIRQKREKQARRLLELQEKSSRIEKAMEPQRKRHGYVWLLQRGK